MIIPWGRKHGSVNSVGDAELSPQATLKFPFVVTLSPAPLLLSQFAVHCLSQQSADSSPKPQQQPPIINKVLLS